MSGTPGPDAASPLPGTGNRAHTLPSEPFSDATAGEMKIDDTEFGELR